MAIRFQCPKCDSPIQVPDDAAGKVGSCPACAVKIRVPEVEIPPRESVPGRDPAVPERVPVDENPIPDFSSQETPAAVAAPGEPSTVDEGGLPVIQETVLDGESMTRRLQRRQESSSRALFIPLICCGIFLAVLAAVGFRSGLLSTKGSLHGKLRATTGKEIYLGPGFLPKASIGVDDETAAAVFEGLGGDPEILLSELMRVEFHGEPGTLKIELLAQRDTDFFVVPIEQSPPLVEFERDQQVALDGLRMAELKPAAKKFCRQYAAAQIDGRAVEGIGDFRDSVGLNTMVGGLGFVVEARIEKQVSGRRAVIGRRCVAEQNGNLYFLLPRGTKKFQLTGRTLADGSVPFPGEFTVAVGPGR